LRKLFLKKVSFPIDFPGEFSISFREENMEKVFVNSNKSERKYLSEIKKENYTKKIYFFKGKF
jgi:hypothetical protein